MDVKIDSSSGSSKHMPLPNWNLEYAAHSQEIKNSFSIYARYRDDLKTTNNEAYQTVKNIVSNWSGRCKNQSFAEIAFFSLFLGTIS